MAIDIYNRGIFSGISKPILFIWVLATLILADEESVSKVIQGEPEIYFEAAQLTQANGAMDGFSFSIYNTSEKNIFSHIIDRPVDSAISILLTADGRPMFGMELSARVFDPPGDENHKIPPDSLRYEVITLKAKSRVTWFFSLKDILGKSVVLDSNKSYSIMIIYEYYLPVKNGSRKILGMPVKRVSRDLSFYDIRLSPAIMRGEPLKNHLYNKLNARAKE